MNFRKLFVVLCSLAVSVPALACDPAAGSGQCTWDGVNYGPSRFGYVGMGDYGYSRSEPSPTPPVQYGLPVRYGMVGYSKRLDKVFQVDNYSSLTEANSALVRQCGSDCSTLTMYMNGCSVAVSGQVRRGKSLVPLVLTGGGDTVSEARAEAFRRCNSRASNCVELMSGCSFY